MAAAQGKVIITCAVTGAIHTPTMSPHLPITPDEIIEASIAAAEAGAAIVHLHAREPTDDKPTQEPAMFMRFLPKIKSASNVVINLTTGVVGRDVSGPLACIRRVRPEIAACNAGSLNYLKIKDNGEWAWPPMVFDNPVAKVQQYLDVMAECGVHPEFECFDVGIVRSVGMYLKAGLFTGVPELNFVMGVASGAVLVELDIPEQA